MVGTFVGCVVGIDVTGAWVGLELIGDLVGIEVDGERVGLENDGESVGLVVDGEKEGLAVVGYLDGTSVGIAVGMLELGWVLGARLGGLVSSSPDTNTNRTFITATNCNPRRNDHAIVYCS